MGILKKSDIKVDIDYEELQKEISRSFENAINKKLKNGINVISYREFLIDGLDETHFFEVINRIAESGWKVTIGEFDIFIE